MTAQRRESALAEGNRANEQRTDTGGLGFGGGGGVLLD